PHAEVAPSADFVKTITCKLCLAGPSAGGRVLTRGPHPARRRRGLAVGLPATVLHLGVFAVPNTSSSSATSATGTPAKPFRVAFIGAGGIALHHLKHLKHIPGVEVIAASDISEKALQKVKDSYGV